MTLICSLENIPENGALIVVQQAGRLNVYHNRCPHQGTPLDWMPDQFMDYEGNYLQCATHGALFRIEDGQCISGPCRGKSLEAVAFALRDDGLYLTTPATPDSAQQRHSR